MQLTLLDGSTRLTRLAGTVRPAAVAGLFYPGDSGALRDAVEALLRDADAGDRAPKAIIAPHAGYVYSGPVAAAAYARLHAIRERIRRVVLLGPAHRVYLRTLALPSVDRFATPLGEVEIDAAAAKSIRGLPQVVVMDGAHAEEHSLEVHLPFLQSLCEDFTIVPLVVGDVSPAAVAEVIERLWGGDETLIVISSDLSHYEDYDTARRLDSATSDAICALRGADIGPHDACGCMPLKGLLHLARDRNLRIELLDLRSSGDTAGPRDRVVGYGAYAVFADDQPDLGEVLLSAARTSIREAMRSGRQWCPDMDAATAPLKEVRATFVTVTCDGRLRGCIGATEATEPLLESVAGSAYRAAFQDPRFQPLTPDEMEGMRLSVSVLSPPERVAFSSEADLLSSLRPGTDGLIIARGDRRATFLPSVWEGIPDAAEFLAQLKRKARIAPEEVPDQAWRYTTTCYEEKRG